MKCANCQAETGTDQRFCADCLKSLSSEIIQFNKKPAPKLKTPLVKQKFDYYTSQVPAGLVSINPILETPASSIITSRESTVDSTVEEMVQSRVSVLILPLSTVFLIAVLIFGGLVFPQVQALQFSQKISDPIAKVDSSLRDTLRSISDISNYELDTTSSQPLPQALRESDITNINLTFNGKSKTVGNVAGASTQVLEMQRLDNVAKGKMVVSQKALNDLELIELPTLVGKKGTLLESDFNQFKIQAQTLQKEASSIIEFDDLNLKASQKVTEITDSIENAANVGDPVVFMQKLNQSISDLNGVQLELEQADIPASGGEINSINIESVRSLKKLISDLGVAVNTKDESKLKTSVNTFLVDIISLTQRYVDANKRFWQGLNLGDDFQKLEENKSAVLSLIETIKNNRIDPIAINLSFGK